MGRRSVRLLFTGMTALWLGLFAGAEGAVAQGLTTGAITGRVTDAGGDPVAGALVRVTSVERGTAREATTNEDGRYIIPLLQPGPYEVRAEMLPLDPVQAGPVTVTVGERAVVNLTFAPVEVEGVLVEVEGVNVDIAQGGVVEVVTESQIANLPTAGRDFTDFINLSALVAPQPGVSTGGQFSIGGARTSGTNIQIDGADANNAFFGENRGSSRIPFAFSLESIREFQIITNGYDVEYGKFSGGLINAVTKGGTNETRGSGFLFWRDEALTAENFNGQQPADFQSFQFGGVVSGPVIEDRLHYFVSADIQQRNQPTFALDPQRANISQATLDEFQEVLTSVYGFTESELADDFGVFDETDDQIALFGRLDWTMNPDHRLSFRINYSDFENQNDRISSSGLEARTRGGTFIDEAISAVAELNSVFGDGIYNTFRVQYSNEDRPRPGNSTLPSVEVEVSNLDGRTVDLGWGGSFFGILFDNRLEEEKFQITDNLTFQLGDHSLKVGTDNVFTSTTNRFWLNGNGFFVFDDMDAFRNQDSGFFFRLTPSLDNPQPPVATFDTQEWAFYVQDEWQVSDKLLVIGGLRWDRTVWADEGVPLADAALQDTLKNTFGVSPTTVPEDNDNFGPRLSFTYDFDGDGARILRGGAGLFFGRIPSVVHGNVLQTTPEPLLATICIGSAVPDPDLASFRDRDNIPARCKFDGLGFPDGEFGLGITGTPQVSVWDEDTQNPETWKFNLGYEQRVAERWRLGLQAIYSRTTHNFGGRELNLRDPVSTLADGRPVFEDSDTDRTRHPDFDRVFLQTSNGEAEAWNFKVDLSGSPRDDLFVAANYALNFAYDNNTTECCTAFALIFDTPTAGDPNFQGDFGDEHPGSWGQSRVVNRHVLVLNGIWRLPYDFRIGAIYRAQSGNPYTPVVDGDINGDGEDENDRPFIPDPDNVQNLQFASAGDLDAFRGLVAEHECLSEAVGTIIRRNTCTNPWFHSVNLKITKGFETVRGQRAELVLDLFNVLDGLGMDAGEWVFESNALFEVVGFDEATNEFVYEVSDFGREFPVGFEPFQFQAQLGVRYTF